MAITGYTTTQADALLAQALATLLSKYVPAQPSAPDTSKATVWVDTSTIPQVLKGWTGSVWVPIGGSGGARTLVAGSGISIVTNTAANTQTISSTGTGSGAATESALVSVRRQVNGTYPTNSPLQADTTLLWIGATVPDSSNPALVDGALFSMMDAST
jgi:hypothetical protein